jgi:Holliday junction resolvase RusA-like endonuclease
VIRLTFIVPEKPAGYSRDAARWSGGRRGHLPEANKVWRAAVREAFDAAMVRDGWSGQHEKGVILAVAFYGSRCDLDNLLKELQDALNDHAYKDDRQVYQVEMARGLDPDHPPGAVVTLTFTDDDPFPRKTPKPRARKRKAA